MPALGYVVEAFWRIVAGCSKSNVWAIGGNKILALSGKIEMGADYGTGVGNRAGQGRLEIFNGLEIAPPGSD